MQRMYVAAGLILATLLAGCASPASPAMKEQAAPAPRAEVAMAGRWVLSGPNTTSCEMRFGGSALGGTIEPGAGCPGDFFTSRQWTLAGGRLTINDYQGQTLANLMLSHGRFTGRADTGMPVTLARSAPPPTGAPWPNINSTASPNPATPTVRH